MCFDSTVKKMDCFKFRMAHKRITPAVYFPVFHIIKKNIVEHNFECVQFLNAVLYFRHSFTYKHSGAVIFLHTVFQKRQCQRLNDRVRFKTFQKYIDLFQQCIKMIHIDFAVIFVNCFCYGIGAFFSLFHEI